MNIYISADIEGISGVVHRVQTASGSIDYERARKLMTEEVNAAIDGAVDAGADRILVNDSHGSMRNIIIEELRPQARLITGFPKSLVMMEGIDESFDGAIFIGYHAMASGNGILAHTMSSSTFSFIEINGKRFGETELNAAVAGCFGVPVLAVSGDNSLKDEALSFLPDIEAAVVKEAHGNLVADCLNPENARKLIREKVKIAVLNREKCKPFIIDGPVELKVGCKTVAIADVLQVIPEVKRISPDTLIYNAGCFTNAEKMITTMMCVASILLIDIYK